MRTLLACTAWAPTAGDLAARLGRWVNHHARLPYASEVVLAAVGDGIAPAIPWPAGRYEAVNLVPHLGRPSHLDYPGWWRSFGHAATLARARGCGRIWHVESDFFLASARMLARLEEIERGWVAFWCPRHGFPETAIQVIGEEHYGTLQELGERGSRGGLTGQHAEHVLPFTEVVRDMVGDRFGEVGTLPGDIPGLDYYGQCPGHIPMLYRAEEEALR